MFQGCLLILVLLLSQHSLASFKLHLNNEPSSLNPALQKSGASSYLLFNLHRNFLKINNNGELENDLAEFCKQSGKKITCKLKSDAKWSDGSPLVAKDFLNSYKWILTAKNKAPRSDLLFALQDAERFYQGQAESFGVKEIDSRTIVFHLKSEEHEFIYNLANYILSPFDPSLKKYSGPFQLGQITKFKNIELISNPHYWQKNPDRPKLDFLIIEEDSVALNLYQKKKLDFLRRLPTALIPLYKKNPEFHWISLWRFDYIGFLQNDSGLSLKQRKDLSESLNFSELKKIFNSEGMPGCPGLPAFWFKNDSPDCLKFREGPFENIQTTINQMAYSLAGGDDHLRALEWISAQWNKNLKFQTQVRGVENKSFTEELKNKKHFIFRRGIALDRPSCFTAFNNFTSQHPENFITFKNPDFDHLVDRLKTESNPEKKKALCSQGLKILLDHYALIPTGPIHFAILSSAKYKGWTLNAMNLLDLSNLKLSQ